MVKSEVEGVVSCAGRDACDGDGSVFRPAA